MRPYMKHSGCRCVQSCVYPKHQNSHLDNSRGTTPLWFEDQDVYDILKKTTESPESSQILFCSMRAVLSTSWVGSGRTRSYFDRGEVVQNFCILGRFLLRRSCLFETLDEVTRYCTVSGYREG
jgi:hypothetical protein